MARQKYAMVTLKFEPAMSACSWLPGSALKKMRIGLKIELKRPVWAIPLAIYYQ